MNPQGLYLGQKLTLALEILRIRKGRDCISIMMPRVLLGAAVSRIFFHVNQHSTERMRVPRQIEGKTGCSFPHRHRQPRKHG